MSYLGPLMTGKATSVYNISEGAAWGDKALADLSALVISPRAVASTDRMTYLMIENTHATQNLRVRFKTGVGAAATDGTLIPALSMRAFSLTGQLVEILSIYGSGAATTGVATIVWGNP